MEGLTERLKALGMQLGFQRVGITTAGPSLSHEAYSEWLNAGFHGEMAYLANHEPLKRHPGHLLEGVRSLVAVSLNYNQPNPAKEGHPRIARYALGRDYHKVVRGKLRRLQELIEEEQPEAICRICVDSAPLMEREYAHRAGLGWFGKNTCLIDSHHGSWFVLGFLLTTVELTSDEPSAGGCGTCRACIEACPTGAIVQLNGRWAVDARHCISYLTIEKRGDLTTQESEGLHEWTFGCDVCQEICPFNSPRESQPLRAQITQEKDFLTKREWPSLTQLAQMREAEWDALTQGSPTRRAGREGLQRNAKANLKNRS